MDEEPTSKKETTTPEKSIAADLLLRLHELNQGLFDSHKTLQLLYETGQLDEFGTKLDELSSEFMEQDTNYIFLRQQLKQVRQAGGPKMDEHENFFRTKIKDIYDKYRQLIITDLNLPEKARLNARDLAASEVRDYLKASGFNGDDPKEALRLLGAAVPMDDGTINYHFPVEFMSPDVVTKWETYNALVLEHLRAIYSLENDKGGTKADVDATDRTRKSTHDVLTNDVHIILGLDGMNGWDWKSTRKLIENTINQMYKGEAHGLTPHGKKILQDHAANLTITQQMRIIKP